MYEVTYVEHWNGSTLIPFNIMGFMSHYTGIARTRTLQTALSI